MVATSSKTGVLLVNTGTPAAPTPRAVRSFLSRFLMHRRIAPMNRIVWWWILHLFILPKRGKASAEKYALIWTDEGSPSTVAHDALARGVGEELAARGFDVSVRVAMSFSEPRVGESIRALRKSGCDRVVVLPLYPQSAYSTTGAVRDEVASAVRLSRFRDSVEVVEDYHANPTYLRAIAASIRHAGFDPQSDDRLLFSYHSIPLADIEAGDRYELQSGASSLRIAEELGLARDRWTIAYQCRFDKDRDWLAPSTADTLARWADVGDGRVFVVCPNFAVDCLETLYDIKRVLEPEYLDRRRAAGHPTDTGCFVYVPCLGKSKAHVRVLCDVIEDRLV